MQYAAIFSATLGLSHPWQVTAVSIAKDVKRMDITIDYTDWSGVVCPICGKEGKALAARSETWHHADFFRYETFLHASVPCLECQCCGALPVERPWNRKGSRFTLVR